MIPFLDLKSINRVYRDELISAITRVVDSGWYINGTEVNAFEDEFSKFCGVKHCVGVANGLDALVLTLRAWKELGRIAEGDEVIVPANTYIATILAIVEAGLRPVLVEPELSSFNISVSSIRAALTKKTKVIMVVHLYGRLAPIEGIRRIADEHGIFVLEDAAQAHGAERNNKRAGSFGHAAAFSFYPGKNLGAMGDAGCITTDDDGLAEVAKALGNYGSTKKYVHDYRGVNSRLDEIQAAVLRVKLKYLVEDAERRRAIADIYTSGIINKLIALPIDQSYMDDLFNEHVFHLYVIRTPDRATLMQHLVDVGIHAHIHYPTPPHFQKAFAEWRDLSLPVTEKIHAEVLSLPISPAMTDLAANKIVSACNDYRSN